MIYFVSLGPGDPELITLKALHTLQRADCIYTPVPTTSKGRHTSKAAEMMRSLGIREEQIQLYDLPMSKDRDGALEAYTLVADEVVRREEADPEALLVIVAEGDCGFYSSSAYIGEHIEAPRRISSVASPPSSPAIVSWGDSSSSSRSSARSSQAQPPKRNGVELGRAHTPSS